MSSKQRISWIALALCAAVVFVIFGNDGAFFTKNESAASDPLLQNAAASRAPMARAEGTGDVRDADRGDGADANSARRKPAAGAPGVTGRIVDSAGMAVAGARVHFWLLDDLKCGMQVHPHGHQGFDIISSGHVTRRDVPAWICEFTIPNCEFQTVAREDGKFDWASPEPGETNCGFIVQAGGFLSKVILQIDSGGGEGIPLRGANNIQIPDIVLERGATLHGRLTAEDGGVPAGIKRVMLQDHRMLPSVSNDGDVRLGTVHYHLETGEYTISGIATGIYSLAVEEELESWRSPPISVERAETIERDFTLPFRTNRNDIRVLLDLPWRAAMPDRDRVTAVPASGGPARHPEREYGGYVFRDLPADKYNLQIDDPRFEPLQIKNIQPGPRVRVDATLAGRSTITLEARDSATGELLPLLHVAVGYPGAPPRWQDAYDSGGAPYVMEGFPAGRCELLIYNEEHPAQMLTIENLAPGERKLVRVSLDPLVAEESFATISGRVTLAGSPPDPDNVPYLQLLALEDVPELPGRALPQREARPLGAIRVMADQAAQEDGSFLFHHIQPGIYQIVAMLDDREARSGKINITKAGTAGPVLISIPAPSRLRGRLILPPALARESLHLRAIQGDTVLDETVGADGSFAFKELGAGMIRLVLYWNAAFSMPVAEFEIPAGADWDREFDVTNIGIGGVSARIVLNGRPVPWAQVGIQWNHHAENEDNLIADARAMVKFDSLPAGKYNIWMTAPGNPWIYTLNEDFTIEENRVRETDLIFYNYEGEIELVDEAGRPVISHFIQVRQIAGDEGPEDDVYQAARVSHYKLSLPRGVWQFRTGPYGWSQPVEWTASGPQRTKVVIRDEGK